MTNEQLQEIGFIKTAGGTDLQIGDDTRMVYFYPGSNSWYCRYKSRNSSLIPAPKDIGGVYKLLEVFEIPFSSVKTAEQKLVAYKWLPLRAGEFRTVGIGGLGNRLIYQISSEGHFLLLEGNASRLPLLDNATPELAQKIFLTLSGQ